MTDAMAVAREERLDRLRQTHPSEHGSDKSRRECSICFLLEALREREQAVWREGWEAGREFAARLVDPIPPDDRVPTDDPFVEACREFTRHLSQNIRRAAPPPRAGLEGEPSNG